MRTSVLYLYFEIHGTRRIREEAWRAPASVDTITDFVEFIRKDQGYSTPSSASEHVLRVEKEDCYLC